jgi:two-component system, chemotaxis family, sensor kinase CheA
MGKMKQISLGQGLKALIQEKSPTADSDKTDEVASQDAVNLPDDPVSAITNEQPVEILNTIAIDDVDLFMSFVQESQDHLSNIEEKILRLEGGNDPTVVNEIFRSMHTMKGSSAFFGLDNIKELSHSLESALDGLRNDELTVDAELIDVLLAGTDVLVKLLGDLYTSISHIRTEDAPIEIQVSQLDIHPIVQRIQMHVSRDSSAPAKSESQTDAASDAENETVKETVSKSVNDTASESALQTEELITPELMASFSAEARDLIDIAEKEVLSLETSPDKPELLDSAFRAIHTLKGNAGFLGFDEVEALCMELESNLDSIRIGKKKIRPKTISILLNTLDSMGRLLSKSDDSEDAVDKREDNAVESDGAESDGADETEYKPLGEILIDLGETSEDEVEKALENQERKLGEILLSEGAVSETGLNKALKVQEKTAVTSSAPPARGGPERKDIRVDMNKLDKMFDLMGELITAEAMVIHNPELAHIESFSRAAVYLSKITREMQEITMSVRMIPLEGLFNKMRRLVRDLSRKFGKKVDLIVSGQDTEMDRNIIEEISDPLIHIIRNSVDHGIEQPGNREAAGKNETGTIELSAKYEGNEIWITIADDGNGLHREKILEKAREKDLLKADSESMTDEEVWQLLFEPGFSTAERVSEVSGRGVGMDVVKRNIEKLRGKITVDSTPFEGTELILKIPLTLAIIDGITFHVGNVLYALPISDILEFHKVSATQITRTGADREVLRLRDDLIPVIRLYNFFYDSLEQSDIEEGIVIVVQANGRKAGFLADAIVGYQQIVVKGLPPYLGKMRAISGCSIMGDGDVSLIVDTGSLLKSELE